MSIANAVEHDAEFRARAELHGPEHACLWLVNRAAHNRITPENAAVILSQHIAARVASKTARVSKTCPECGREFDMADETDAEEWHYGHDCEAS